MRSLRLTPSEAEALSPSRLMSRKIRRPLLIAVAMKAGLTKGETKGLGTRLLRRRIVDALASSEGQTRSKASRVKLTSGSLDPAMMLAEGISDSLLLDKNGNALKGTAKLARIEKLRRESPEGILDKKAAKAAGKKKAAKAAKTAKAAKAAEAVTPKAESLEARMERIEDSLGTMAEAMAKLTAAFTS